MYGFSSWTLKSASRQLKRIAGLRDVLIHVYFGVNLERVWVIVKDDLPDLKKKIKNILDEMGRDKD